MIREIILDLVNYEGWVQEHGTLTIKQGLAKVSPFTTPLMAFNYLLPWIEETRTEFCTGSLQEDCPLASSRSASESYPVHSHPLPISAENFAFDFDVTSPDVTAPFPRSHTSASASDSVQSV